VNAYDHSVRIAEWASVLETQCIEGATLHAAQSLTRINNELGLIAAALVKEGIAAGLTQRQLAAALDVPESTLRGARRELGATRA